MDTNINKDEEIKVTEPIEEGEAKDFCADPKAMAGLLSKVDELEEQVKTETKQEEGSA
jgi:hypothetical protein